MIENQIPVIKDIQKREKQSTYLVEISKRIASGQRISHMLNYNISIHPIIANQASDIKKYFKRSICENYIFELVNVAHGEDVSVRIPVKWEMPTAGETCSYYYTNSNISNRYDSFV